MQEYYLPKFAIYDRDFRHQSVLFGGSSHWPFKGQSRFYGNGIFFIASFILLLLRVIVEIRKKEETRKNSGIYLFLCVKSMNIHIGCFVNRGQFKLSKILRAIH